MSEKTYTVEELLAAWKKVEAEKIQKFEAELKMLRARELKKALVPPHKHDEGTTASGGIEDVPSDKMTDKTEVSVSVSASDDDGGSVSRSFSFDTKDAKKAEKKAEKKGAICAKCGMMKSMCKCSLMKDVAPSGFMKAMVSDEKGKLIDTGKRDGSKLAHDAKEKQYNEGTESDPGSGGIITKGPKAIRKAAAQGGPAKTNTNDAAKKMGAPKRSATEMQPDSKLPQEPEKLNTQKAEFLSKPPVSEAQRRAMFAAASGHSTLGIPKSVGKEFSDADQGGKLPEHKKTKKDEVPMAKEHIGFDKLKNKLAHKPGVSDPAAVAAAIGRKKYGQAEMSRAAHAGKAAHKAEPPMAKPPSGKNMATAVPTSKPMAAPKMGMMKEEKGAVNSDPIEKAADKESVYRERYEKEQAAKRAEADKKAHAEHGKMKNTIRNLSPNSPFKRDLAGGSLRVNKDAIADAGPMSEMAAPDSTGYSMRSELPMKKDSMTETKPMGKPGIFGRLHGGMHAAGNAMSKPAAMPMAAPKPAIPAMGAGPGHAAQAPTTPGAMGSQIAKPLAPMPKLKPAAVAAGVKQYGQGLPTAPGGPGAEKTSASRPSAMTTSIKTAPATGATVPGKK